ncbi:MAG: SCO family protein [Calditrichaeota bacterium]|nr:MAG: SCO family protein [Calditrichota bacterium]
MKKNKIKKSGILLIYLIWVNIVFVSLVSAQVIKDEVEELKGVDVEEHLGDKIPMDLRFIDDSGNEVTIGSYFNQEQPVLLVLGYYKCPMLCNLVFNGLIEGVRSLDIKPGEDFQMVAVSINHREDFNLAAAKKANYLTAMDIPSAEKGWKFLVGDSTQSQALADAVGFQYRYDEEIGQYAHPAVIYLLTENGTISRYLYGVEFKTNDLKFSLLEASEGKIGNTIDRIILYCYHYDPDSKGYVVFAGNVMRLGGAITLIVLSVFVGLLFYRERRKKNQQISVVVH